MRSLKNQSGFHVLELVIVLLVVSVIGGIGWKVFTKQNTASATTYKNESNKSAVETVPTFSTTEFPDSSWELSNTGEWVDLNGNAPTCPDPFILAAPTDLSLATSVLIPGQTRTGSFAGQSGSYKPHGGLRFDSSNPGDIKVYSPIDGYITNGNRFLVNGEVQYYFDIVHPCGYLVRIGHLRKLTNAMERMVEKLPEAQEMNTQSVQIDPPKLVKAGEQIATAVGFEQTNNTFLDIGVYDLRKPNAASQSEFYKQSHAGSKDTAYYAVCWLEMMNESDVAILQSLPAGDTENGSKSDYCM